MTSVEMTDTEWQQVLGILSMAPWRDANPLLMKIGEQLRVNHQVHGNSAGMGELKVTSEMKVKAKQALDDLKN